MLLHEAPCHSRLDAGLRADRRVDPYWGGLFSTGADAVWSSAAMMRARADAGLGRALSLWGSMSPEEGWEVLDDARHRPAVVSAVGALLGWRTMTSQQAACISGYGPLASASHVVRALFATGLADVGSFVHPTMSRPARAEYALVGLRPSGSKEISRRFLPQASWAERMAITAGRPGAVMGGQYDRHNMVTTELALRVAEMCPIGAVLAETVSTMDMLLGSGLGRAEIVSTRSADATFVREDGLRLAVEVTASSAPGVKRKMVAWADALSRTSLERTGLMVVFVVATPPDRGTSALAEVRSTLARIARDFPGRPGDRPADRMFVADYATWFPGPGQVDPSFLDLAAWKYDGQMVSLLDPFDTTFEGQDDRFAAVLDNARLLAASPYWMRGTPQEEGLWAVSTKDVPGPVVHPIHKSNWVPAQRVGSAARGGGAAGSQRVPRDLLVPTYAGSQRSIP